MNREVGDTSSCKVFVGGLDPETSSYALKTFFEQYGEIVDSIVMTDQESGKSRGFGFVTFAKMDSVDRCLAGKPHMLDNREVEAKKAIPKEEFHPQNDTRTKKVFLGGISPETTRDEISDVMEAFGEIQDVQIMTEKYTNRPRGFAFVTFKEYDVVDALCRKKYHRIKDRDVEVKKAVSQDDIRKQGGMGADRSGGGGGGGGGKSRGYSDQGLGGRGALADPYGGARYKAGYPMDYRMSRYDYQYNEYMREYGYPHMYGRSPAATAAAYGKYDYDYGRYNQQGYDMSYGMYPTQGGMGMGTYHQTPSNYGPSRGGYGGMDKDKERGGASGHGGYHPYRR